MKNGIDNLRDHLFVALERLNDLEVPVNVDREKQICAVASVMVESAKAEALMMQAMGHSTTTSALWREKPALPAMTSTASAPLRIVSGGGQ